jgi:hypothetical protein|tara:strand:+ start:923 stop:1129 length:207 start_codon:yes stop_codon:yes gene_type:complete
MMKVGDIVMFTDKGRYKKWFYGKIGTITSAVGGGVSVQWMYPVAYLDMRRVTTSNFSADYFTLMRAKK